MSEQIKKDQIAENINHKEHRGGTENTKNKNEGYSNMDGQIQQNNDEIIINQHLSAIFAFISVHQSNQCYQCAKY